MLVGPYIDICSAKDSLTLGMPMLLFYWHVCSNLY